MAEQIILNKTADPIKVKLIKGQKDTYAWEISIQDDDMDYVLREIAEINTQLKELYGGGE